MNIRTAIAIAILSVVGSTAAMAQAASGMPLTRAEVRQSVIDARKAGELFATGEGDDYPAPQKAVASTLARSTVHAQVLAALASDSLIASGEGEGEVVGHTAVSSGSGLTRADVKLATLKALDAGGQFATGDNDGDALEIARDRAQHQYARTAHLARKAMPVVASN